MRWIAALLLVAWPALAQERPLTTPTRDVDVTYRATVGGQAPVEQRSRFSITQRKIRIDTPSPGLYIIVDRGAETMDMVSDGDHGVLRMPYDLARSVGGVSPNQVFVKQGGDTVAGVPCTNWQTKDTAGQILVVCMTADGVLLRVKSADQVFVQAARIVYGPIDPAVFVIPPGYERRSPQDPR